MSEGSRVHSAADTYFEDLLASSSRSLIQDFDVREKTATLAQTRVTELLNIIRMRFYWSNLLMVLVGSIVIFQMLLFIAVGAGVLTYTDTTLLRIMYPTSFAEIMALVFVVIRFLFTPKTDFSHGKD